MVQQIVEDFYRMLFNRARKRYEKPIFLLATFRYILDTDSIGIDLLELLSIKHTIHTITFRFIIRSQTFWAPLPLPRFVEIFLRDDYESKYQWEY